MIVTLTIPGEPAVKERPRCGRKVRSTKRQVQAEHEIGRILQERYIVLEPHWGTVRLWVVFVTHSTRKDFDNMAKLVADALQGGVLYANDAQIEEAVIRVIRAPNREPGTRIEVDLVGNESVIEREA